MKNFFLQFRVIYLIILCGIFPQLAAANDVIKIQFNQRPPYMWRTDSGVIEGLLVHRTEDIFKSAGIAMVWDITSVNRAWFELSNPTEMTCTIGWFKSPEREKIAKFTKEIYPGQQYVLLARKQISFNKNITLENILSMNGIRVLIKNKYSYGMKINSALKKISPTLIASDAENQQMVKLLIANRADFMFSSKEEAQYLLENSDNKESLQIFIPQHMPIGEKRYIACNKLVTDKLMDRLNSAIN